MSNPTPPHAGASAAAAPRTRELRPVHTSFVFARLSGALIGYAVLAFVATIGVAATLPQAAALPSLLVLPLLAFSLVTATAAARKERYVFGPHTIVAYGGGLFSDRQVDLDLRNVTHVRQRLPWIRYRFFNVGDVLIESAGSGQSEVVLHSVRDPDRVYAMVRDALRANGFSLQQTRLVHEERPALIGVVLEVLGLATMVLGVGMWLIVAVFVELTGGLDLLGAAVQGKTGLGLPPLLGTLIYVLPVLFALWFIPFLVLRFLDLQRRTYRVFDDVVVYEEGFLTRTNAFIPAENIADADIAKTLLDRVLDLSDVKVSCQGSSQEIRFRRLARGDQMKEAVAGLVAAAHQSRRNARLADSDADAAPSAGRARVGAPPPPLIDPTLAWTATLRPLPTRAVAGLLPLLPLLPFWLVATVMEWVRASATTYTVGRTSVGQRTSVLAMTEREFSYDKVTGVLVRSSPLDRMLGTCAIEVWSIGSTLPIVMAHVRRDEVELDRLLANLGISLAPPANELRTTFGLGVWIRASLPGFVLNALIVLVLVGVAALTDMWIVLGALFPFFALIAAAYVWRQLWVARQTLTLHATHVELRQGVWWRSHAYVRYDNIKKTEVTRYPGTDAGHLRLYVAGERLAQQQQQKGQGGIPIPYSIAAAFLADVRGLSARLDEVFSRVRDAGDTSPVAPTSVEIDVQPAPINAMVGALILSVFLLPLAPFILLLTWLRVRRRSYRIEGERVVRAEGLLFKRESSVLFERIDSIRQDQGPLGKLFGNGQVTVLTAGSSRPDLVLDALRDHTAVYRLLRSRYGRGAE